jgi:hypothetical protein
MDGVHHHDHPPSLYCHHCQTNHDSHATSSLKTKFKASQFCDRAIKTMANREIKILNISECAALCLRSFDDCLTRLGCSAPERLSLFEDQLARFNIWISSIGVFASGKASMDYRLRDVPEIQSVVVASLDTLNDHIQDCKLFNSAMYSHHFESSLQLSTCGFWTPLLPFLAVY